MRDLLGGWPYPVAVATLYVVVLLRAGGTYALGRGAHAGAERTRVRSMLARPGFRRAEGLVARWGAPVVALSFLTVGLQTLVNLAAGVARMPVRRYLPALAVGGLAWALIYGTAWTVGLAGVRALWELSPVAASVVVVVLVVASAAWITAQVRRREEEVAPGGAAELAADDRRP